MKVEDMEGWGSSDIPLDGYASEGEINIHKLVAEQSRKKKKKVGGFQAMGLNRRVLQGVMHKGYKIPTDIQKRTIPLILEGKDVVAMARTGSGKTAAFLIPMFEKLKLHPAKIGVRALILAPTRELALQTLSFAKELGKYTDLRCAAILGGESLENQFACIHENPDIIIGTPGRFTHVCIEMNLKLDTVEYVVFDEADRLFEMGFKEQLNDIIARLSPLRQTLLFSATLPGLLVEFAKAGLTDPTLIRLDRDKKISDNLKLGFFKISPNDKVALLIHVLKTVIGPSEPTVVFVPTKHHVEYIHNVLTSIGLASTCIYSALDPSARKINIAKFRAKKVNLLIVTDVAARGIDIPLLDNVINFNFPTQTKLFVHRVGRVARAGRTGTAYSFVSPDEISYLLELHMFLSKSIKFCPLPEEGGLSQGQMEDWDRMLGAVPQDIIDDNSDSINKALDQSYDLRNMQKAASNSILKYIRTRPRSSAESCRRLKEDLWGREVGFHPLFRQDDGTTTFESERMELLETLKNIRPKATIFEIKKDAKKGGIEKSSTVALMMQEKRKVDDEKIEHFHMKMKQRKMKVLERKEQLKEAQKLREGVKESSEMDLQSTFRSVIGKRRTTTGANCEPLGNRTGEQADANQFIPYTPFDYYAEQSYSVMSNFERESANAKLDLTADSEKPMNPNRARVKWDRKLMKFKGQDSEKKIKTESGVWVPASYKRDLYEKWKLKVQLENSEEPDEEEDDGSEMRKRNKGSRGKGFICLTESELKHKPHPLMKGRKKERNPVRGQVQAMSYVDRVKAEKVKKKKITFMKQREKLREMKKSKKGRGSGFSAGQKKKKF